MISRIRNFFNAMMANYEIYSAITTYVNLLTENGKFDDSGQVLIQSITVREGVTLIVSEGLTGGFNYKIYVNQSPDDVDSVPIYDGKMLDIKYTASLLKIFNIAILEEEAVKKEKQALWCKRQSKALDDLNDFIKKEEK